MTVTILSDNGTVAAPSARADDGGLWLRADELETATGWLLKPEGLCRGDVCIPLRPEMRAGIATDGAIDAAGLWPQLSRPVASSERGDVWVLGEAAEERTAALEGLEAPDFALPDLDGRTHRLSNYRGQKVLLTTWSSW